MTSNELKDFVQRSAVEAWIKANKRGTFELSTGTGKTIAALHCLSTMPRGDGKVHLFLAETNSRKDDLDKDIELYEKLFGLRIRDHYNLVFRCYQGVYNLKDYEFGLVIGDEFHNALSLEYSKFFYNNKYDAIVGLSATIERKTQYETPQGVITKGDMLDEIAPVCYKYTIHESLEDGIGREIRLYVIESELNDKDKTELSGSVKKPFYQTELAKYKYLEKNYKRSFFTLNPNKELMINVSYKKMSEFIYNLKSKINQTKMLVNSIPGKSIIFSNNLKALLEVTPNVVSSYNTDEQNNKLRNDFDKGIIKTIGSFKKLRQGANLKELDNVILMSYYGQETHIVQQVGRLRKNGELPGNVFIFVTKDTFEEKILNKILNYIPYKELKVYKNVENLIKEFL